MSTGIPRDRSFHFGFLTAVPCMHEPQTPQDQWEALKHLVAGHAPLAYNADGEAAAIVARLMEADVVLTTYQANLRSDLPAGFRQC